jgi:hypothetical protein
MAKNDFPKIKPTEKYPLGHAKENKDASKYAKNGASAAAGDAPMVDGGAYMYTKAAKDIGLTDPLPNGVSLGVAREKTDGIVTRGNGAATKGIKARGPMA